MESVNEPETWGRLTTSGSLKARLIMLENAISKIIQEVQQEKREVQQLSSEKQTLEDVLTQKSIELK